MAENLFKFLSGACGFIGLCVICWVLIIEPGKRAVKKYFMKPKPNYSKEVNVKLDEIELNSYHEESTDINNPVELLRKLREQKSVC